MNVTVLFIIVALIVMIVVVLPIVVFRLIPPSVAPLSALVFFFFLFVRSLQVAILVRFSRNLHTTCRSGITRTLLFLVMIGYKMADVAAILYPISQSNTRRGRIFRPTWLKIGTNILERMCYKCAENR